MTAPDEADDMCPNCVTPWKCNGPHLGDQTPRALASQPEPHRHAPEYPSSCTGCEHLAVDLAARLPEGLLPHRASQPEPLDVRRRTLDEVEAAVKVLDEEGYVGHVRASDVLAAIATLRESVR